MVRTPHILPARSRREFLRRAGGFRLRVQVGWWNYETFEVVSPTPQEFERLVSPGIADIKGNRMKEAEARFDEAADRLSEEQRLLVDLFTKSASDFLGQWFESEIVKGALAFDGIDDRTAAESLHGELLFGEPPLSIVAAAAGVGIFIQGIAPDCGFGPRDAGVHGAGEQGHVIGMTFCIQRLVACTVGEGDEYDHTQQNQGSLASR